ncbi:MAG: restriction endonuclease [Pseudomonadota bacterium]
MAEITRKRTGEFLRKLFAILLSAPEGMKGSKALSELAASVNMTPYEAGFYDSGGQRFEKIVRFATVDCTKAGWLHKAKGTWVITEAGKAAYEKILDPEEFYRTAVKLYHQWKAQASSSPESPASPVDDNALGAVDDESQSVSVSFEQAEEQAWTEIESHLLVMDPFDFQDLVADLLRAMGYHVTWRSPPGKDGGVDIIAFTDPLGTQSPRMKVQVKRWKDKVNSDGLKAFVALISTHDVGIFVTLGGFTKDAQDYARQQESRRITLIDAEMLVDLWVEHYAKLSDTARQRMPLAPVHFLVT